MKKKNTMTDCWFTQLVFSIEIQLFLRKRILLSIIIIIINWIVYVFFIYDHVVSGFLILYPNLCFLYYYAII